MEGARGRRGCGGEDLSVVVAQNDHELRGLARAVLRIAPRMKLLCQRLLLLLELLVHRSLQRPYLVRRSHGLGHLLLYRGDRGLLLLLRPPAVRQL